MRSVGRKVFFHLRIQQKKILISHTHLKKFASGQLALPTEQLALHI